MKRVGINLVLLGFTITIFSCVYQRTNQEIFEKMLDNYVKTIQAAAEDNHINESEANKIIKMKDEIDIFLLELENNYENIEEVLEKADEDIEKLYKGKLGDCQYIDQIDYNWFDYYYEF